MNEPAIDDGYLQEAAAEARAAQSDQAQAGADQEARCRRWPNRTRSGTQSRRQ